MGDQLKLPEVARRLGVSEKTARRYVKSGALPSVFVGNAYRVSEEDLEAFLQEAQVRPGGDSPKEFALPQPTLLNGLEAERREPTLSGWIALTEGLLERWSAEAARREHEMQEATPAVRKTVKRPTAATWALELREVYLGVVDGILADPLWPDAYPAGEHARLWRALRGMKKLWDLTDHWFGNETAPQVADIREAMRARSERLEKKFGARAS